MYDNVGVYTDAIGAVVNNFAISDVWYSAIDKKYRVTVVQRVARANGLSLAFSAHGADNDSAHSSPKETFFIGALYQAEETTERQGIGSDESWCRPRAERQRL